MELHPVAHSGDSFEITHKRDFTPDETLSRFRLHKGMVIAKAFAKKMADGKLHREIRSGGSLKRGAPQIKGDATLGKFAEIALFLHLNKLGIQSETPDLKTYERGKWDDFDLSVPGGLMSVKSSKSFANLMLLETKDYNLQGYRHADIQPDWFVFVRVDMDNAIYDIPGYATLDDLRNAIGKMHVVRKDSRLNGRTAMDAENWYIQVGDLRPFPELIRHLREQAFRIASINK